MRDEREMSSGNFYKPKYVYARLYQLHVNFMKSQLKADAIVDVASKWVMVLSEKFTIRSLL